MSDLLFSLGFLATIGIIGLPVVRLLPHHDFPYRLIAAPVFGFGVVGMSIAIAYRHGGSLLGAAATTVIIASLIAVYEAPRFFRQCRSFARPTFLLLAAALSILLLCLAPKWTGGAQYSIFQGNQYDQLHYLTHVATVRNYSYSELLSLDFDKPVLQDGKNTLNSRPTPQLILAAMASVFGADTIQASYPYLAALQVITFFGTSFLVLQVFGCRLAIGILCGAAVTLGFPMQYIFDINAWGKLAGMPAALTGFALFLTVITRSSEEAEIQKYETARLSLSIALIIASLFYFYPEMFPVFGAAAMGALAAWFGLNRHRLAPSRLVPCVLGFVLGSLCCLLYREGTLDFFWYELHFATSVDVDWWKYFQAYLIGDWPPSFIVSAIGLHFILPPTSIPEGIAAGWRIAAYLVTAWVLTAAVVTWLRVDRSQQKAVLFLIGVLTSTLVILVTASTGRYWPAGEAWAMLAPLVFLAIASPLLVHANIPRHFRLAAVFVIFCHVALGLARPVAAASEGGVHYGRPYPGAMDAELKRKYEWNIQRYDARLSACGSIGLDLDNRFLERVVTIYLTDKSRDWETTRPDRLLDSSEVEPAAPLSKGLDCVLTTNFPLPAARKFSVSLSTDKRFENFFNGASRTVEIALPMPAGVEAHGIYSVEPYLNGLLRWTSGNARLVVPNNVTKPATGLEIAAWPVGEPDPSRTMRLTVNGKELFEGEIPVEPDGIRLVIPEQSGDVLDIRLSIRPLENTQDPRDLGVPLRTFSLTR